MFLSTSDHHCKVTQVFPPNFPETSEDFGASQKSGRVNQLGLHRSKVSADPTQSAVSRRLNILIAEDVMVNQLVLGAILNRLGHEADKVNNGLEALEALKGKPYDVILMDICMPYLDGLEATRMIRETSGSSTQPWIIAVTANAILGDQARCLAAGMNDYVSKPVSIKAIESALKHYQEEVVLGD
jgi:CheY-like chemotaxis protein